MSGSPGTRRGVTEEEIITKMLGGREPWALASGGALGALRIAVGHPMPPLLERIHREISDGEYVRWAFALADGNGFEWCCGGGECCGGSTVLAEYARRLRKYTDHPSSLVPIWHRQGNWIFVDFSTPDGQIWRSQGEEAPVPDDNVLVTWLAARLMDDEQGRGLTSRFRGEVDQSGRLHKKSASELERSGLSRARPRQVQGALFA